MSKPIQALPTEPPLPLGTETAYGRIETIGFIGGERYYWMIDKHGCVSMMPYFCVHTDGETKTVRISNESSTLPEV
jgi:hypothetical protein